MRRPRWLPARTPREDPADALTRYAIAIDAQFDDDTASRNQRIDYVTLVGAINSVDEAKTKGMSGRDIHLRAGMAIGLCQAYMDLYDITPSAPPSA